MSDSARILELPPDERPRERLARGGAGALSDAELLAIFIRTGTRGRNAMAVARELLERRGGLRGVAKCGVKELRDSSKGIGPAKATELAAAFEIGKRLARREESRIKADTPERVFDLLYHGMQGQRQEVVCAVLLDTKYQLIRVEEIFRGSLNESIAHPREIFRAALVHSAFAVIVAHNHPSGDPNPSEADKALTRRLASAAGIVGIRMLDHVIIGTPSEGRQPYFSFAAAGLL